MELRKRPRRLRRSETLRRALRETDINRGRLVYPVFVKEEGGPDKIPSMPGLFRWNAEDLIEHLKPVYEKGVRSYALFPVIDENQKDSSGSEALNESGLAPEAVKKLKDAFPDCVLYADVALDPYTDHGHDGLVHEAEILNDETVELLVAQSLVLAKAGADFVCPSDMMDGRIQAIREGLDGGGFNDTAILSYCAKYASALYGPFRGALNSSPKFGDKKTYQMDPGNRREALRELHLDVEEGADIVMVKPAGLYLDVISDFKAHSPVPVGAYQVSGEYSMIMAASEKGWIDRARTIKESLLSIRRAGADIIFTYFAPMA